VLPAELERELKGDRKLRKWFDGMTVDAQRDCKWVMSEGAETRQKRAEKMAERLMQAMEGRRSPPC